MSRNIVVLAVLCGGCTGPVLNCPDSLLVGSEAILTASGVDDAVDWVIEEQTGGAYFQVGEDQTIEATTSIIGDPGFGSGTTEIPVVGDRPGVVIIRINETTIGPGIGPPRPEGADTCTIQILPAFD